MWRQPTEIRALCYDLCAVQRIAASAKDFPHLNLSCLCRLAGQYQKALSEVNETYQFYVSMLDERRAEIARELEQVHTYLHTRPPTYIPTYPVHPSYPPTYPVHPHTYPHTWYIPIPTHLPRYTPIPTHLATRYTLPTHPPTRYTPMPAHLLGTSLLPTHLPTYPENPSYPPTYPIHPSYSVPDR